MIVICRYGKVNWAFAIIHKNIIKLFNNITIEICAVFDYHRSKWLNDLTIIERRMYMGETSRERIIESILERAAQKRSSRICIILMRLLTENIQMQ